MRWGSAGWGRGGSGRVRWGRGRGQGVRWGGFWGLGTSLCELSWARMVRAWGEPRVVVQVSSLSIFSIRVKVFVCH